MKINEVYQVLPGKTGMNQLGLPLWMHLEDTAVVMDYLCAHRTPASVIHACGLERKNFYRVCVFLAMVHDIGKCTPLFVGKLRPYIAAFDEIFSASPLIIPSSDKFLDAKYSPHSRAGEAILNNMGCPNGICSVVGAHHGKPTSGNDIADQIATYPFNYYASQKSIWTELEDLCLSNALQRAGLSVQELPILSNCAQMLLCGMVIQADWIASNQFYFPLLPTDEKYSSYPADRAGQALSKLSLPDVWDAFRDNTDPTQTFIERFSFRPNSMQQLTAGVANEISEPGLMIIEAQMGLGKTEAAMTATEILAAKAGCGGVFFGLPTQATSNGVFPRVTEWASSLSENSTHTIRLAHGMAALNDDYQHFFSESTASDEDEDSRLIAHSWFSGKKQALLADFVVGTVDTALMAALSQKHVMLRHLGLCGKVVVIDECHAYDAYMSKYLDRMLRWLGAYKTPVILLSATLPPKRKEEMLAAYIGEKVQLPSQRGYPLITWTDRREVFASAVQEKAPSKTIRIQRLSDESLTDELRIRLKDGGCAGIIVNTVKRAQRISEDLRREFPDHRICVYHAQFIAQERIRREKELMEMIGKSSSAETRDKVIVVGTQVLEQSLDIDFDYLISDLCPMDLLLQRIGRLHRHERNRPAALRAPVCSVLCPDDGFESGARTIYGDWLLSQTLRYLPDTIRLPDDIPGLVERVYEQSDVFLSDPAYEAFCDQCDIQKSKAHEWLLPAPRQSTRREKSNSIVGMLDKYLESERHAEASVRDGAPSIDVLIMRKAGEDYVGFLPWISGETLRTDTVPSEEEGKKIAMQRLRLPLAFCLGSKLNETITALEKENGNCLSAWQNSAWVKGELILLLDENGEKDLCGYHVHYTKEAGLTYERIGE